ncbi:MAG: sodium:proton antiporter [Saprospiraceae bacterium]|nr:sodium:proton antiporter [Saprospiraceae bacterium]
MLELAGIIILGIFAQWVAWRVKVPAILPLILIGLAVGPLWSLWSEGGDKLIAPMYSQAEEKGLFPGQSLFYFVSLSIGLILFEGGLTLKRKELRGVAPAIVKLITIGTLVTFFGAGLAVHFVMDFSWSISFLFSALIIVTGPTVIAPILQNVPLNRNVSTVLKWEGILIDPVGALAAVLMYEFIVSGEGGFEFSSHAIVTFGQIILIGLALGSLAALFLRYLIKRDLIPPFLLNVFSLALVLGVFVLSDLLAHESGLLSVVVMGMVLGNLDVPRINEILSFKESISVLLISILFILLAANIDIKDLMLLLDWRCLGLFLIVILVLRPIGVFLSTIGSDLKTKEKLFISWVGPRGIVAAGVASLFGIRLLGELDDAEYITPLVFMIVLGTVLLNATTAKLIAKLLGVIQDSSNGILIVGVNTASKMIGKYLMDNGRHVVLIDSNATNVKSATDEGLEAFAANVFNDSLTDRLELVDVGYLLAMTSNSEVNNYALRKLRPIFGEKGAFRLITQAEMKIDKAALPGEGLFSYTDDFLNISEVARDYPYIIEQEIADKDQLERLISQMSNIVRSIPLFLKFPDGFIDVIPLDLANLELPEGSKLIYLGKPLAENVVESV